MSRERQHADPFSYDPRLRKVARYVETHLSDPIALADAAHVAALEPAYFSRYFRKVTGETFTQWLAMTRVARAKLLLLNSRHSVTEVAMMVGFQSLRTFQRRFKEITGSSPHHYRRTR